MAIGCRRQPADRVPRPISFALFEPTCIAVRFVAHPRYAERSAAKAAPTNGRNMAEIEIGSLDRGRGLVGAGLPALG